MCPPRTSAGAGVEVGGDDAEELVGEVGQAAGGEAGSGADVHGLGVGGEREVRKAGGGCGEHEMEMRIWGAERRTQGQRSRLRRGDGRGKRR